MQTKGKSSKKALLKKIIKGKKTGKSPIKLDNGLGNIPLTGGNMTSGGGSNLGTKRVF